MMVGFRVAGVMAMLLLPLSAQNAARLTFRVQVSKLGRETSSFAKSKRPDDFVSVTLPGRLFEPPRAVAPIRRSQAGWNSPDRVIASIRSANTAGDPDWIVQNFVPSERDRIRKMLADSAVAKLNREYYKAVRKVDITGWAELRGLAIVFVREEYGPGTARMVPVTLAKTSSGWKQTNALSNDDTFDVVWMALRYGTVK